MSLIPARCTHCGADIEVDNSMDAAICQYCGSAFVVEKAINNYNVTNYITENVYNFYTPEDDFIIEHNAIVEYRGKDDIVYIPDGIRRIKGGGNGVEGAFRDTNIVEVYIPDSVTHIEGGAFENCEYLTTVHLGCGIRYIGAGVFGNCYRLKSIEIPEGITELDYCCFSACVNLEEIKLPSTLKKIDSQCFANCCSLKHIEFPDGLEEIEGGAFIHCSKLEEVTIPNSLTKLEGAFNTMSGNTIYVKFEDTVKTVNASEGWKRQHYKEFHCLKCYEPVQTIPKKQQTSGGCYVATCVYGSYDCPQVWTLRRYRDYHLSKSWYGRAFIKTYYAISPTLVKWFGDTYLFKRMWKSVLDKMVSRLKNSGYDDTRYYD